MYAKKVEKYVTRMEIGQVQAGHNCLNFGSIHRSEKVNFICQLVDLSLQFVHTLVQLRKALIDVLVHLRKALIDVLVKFFKAHTNQLKQQAGNADANYKDKSDGPTQRSNFNVYNLK